MKKLLKLLSEDELRNAKHGADFEPFNYEALEYELLNHCEELSFNEYYKLRKLKMMNEILEEVRFISTEMSK